MAENELFTIGSSGGIGAVLGAITGFISGKQRIDRIQAEIDRKVEKDVCTVCQDKTEQGFKRIDDNFVRLEGKVDMLIKHTLEGKG